MSTQVYDITNKAGTHVAGIRLTPGQTQITLTPEQAEYELAQGTILPTGQTGNPDPVTLGVEPTDTIYMIRQGRLIRPTAAELATFVVASGSLISAAGDIDLKGQRLFNGRVRINRYTSAVTFSDVDKGACAIVTHASARTFTLPATWAEGDCVAVRRGGAGALVWALEGGATLALPESKAAHTGIAERHEEALFKVLSNTGNAAVWGVTGATA